MIGKFSKLFSNAKIFKFTIIWFVEKGFFLNFGNLYLLSNAYQLNVIFRTVHKTLCFMLLKVNAPEKFFQF